MLLDPPPSASKNLVSTPDQKAKLRARIKGIRSQFDETARARAAFFLCENLWFFLQERNNQSIGVYLARPFEISLQSLISRLANANVTVGAPRVDLQTPSMKFFRFTSEDAVSVGPYGVHQPQSEEEVTPDILLVPGLAFDRRGGRLGTGGGWYDRFAPPQALKIGVGFDFQIVENVPMEPHDLRLDFLASPLAIVPCGAS